MTGNSGCTSSSQTAFVEVVSDVEAVGGVPNEDRNQWCGRNWDDGL